VKSIFRATLALCMLSLSTLADAGTLPAGFTVGYNEAWIENNYGNWLASNPLFHLSSAFPSSFSPPICANNSPLSAMLLGMGQGNAKVVRLFLFPAVQGIIINTSVTSPSSTAVTMTQGLTGEFLTNLTSVFGCVRQYNNKNNTNLKLYITALNGPDMNVVTASNNPVLHLYYQRLLSNSAEIIAYDTLVLEPIIQLMSGYQDVVYAFDLINEIEGAINAGYISWSGARAWISNAAYAINHLPQPQFPWLPPVTSTAGYGYAVQEVTFGFFRGINLNFYDIHVYTDTGTYSGQTYLCSQVASDKLPIILGEFGQHSSSISDSIQNTGAANFLMGASSSCFSGALAWKYEGTSGEPWYSYLYVNLPVPSTGGTLSAPPCPAQQPGLPASVQVPGLACARPAYTTIQNFSLGASKLVSAAKPEVGSTGGTSAPPLNTTSLTDAQVAQVAHVASQIEIANAKLALDKSSNEQVRAFAAATLNDYAAADAATLSSLSSANINVQDNAISESLLGAASEHGQNLSQLSGAAFDEAYAQNELDFHVFICGAIEMTLMPSAQTPHIKKLLQSELGLCQKHLPGARELVGQLQAPTYLPLPPPKHR